MVQAQVAVAVLLLGLAWVGLSQEYPFQNTSLPFPERVKVNTGRSDEDCVYLDLFILSPTPPG